MGVLKKIIKYSFYLLYTVHIPFPDVNLRFIRYLCPDFFKRLSEPELSLKTLSCTLLYTEEKLIVLPHDNKILQTKKYYGFFNRFYVLLHKDIIFFNNSYIARKFLYESKKLYFQTLFLDNFIKMPKNRSFGKSCRAKIRCIFPHGVYNKISSEREEKK